MSQLALVSVAETLVALDLPVHSCSYVAAVAVVVASSYSCSPSGRLGSRHQPRIQRIFAAMVLLLLV